MYRSMYSHLKPTAYRLIQAAEITELMIVYLGKYGEAPIPSGNSVFPGKAESCQLMTDNCQLTAKLCPGPAAPNSLQPKLLQPIIVRYL
ncbi:MAG TPA: hypothetical protein DDY20_08785 [Desulfobulbaceae bacterium]|nr:hypothetical protein [Desulfobulbaceae bacterium]